MRCTLLFAIGFVAITASAARNSSTLRLNAQEPIVSLDPLRSKDQYAHLAVAQVFEGLYHYNYSARPLVVEPLIADGGPQVSKDGKTYTVRIQRGIVFQDDDIFKIKPRVVLAKDVVYSWKRLLDPRHPVDSYWILRDRIVGATAWREKVLKDSAAFDHEISGLKAVDARTVRIQLTQPLPQFMFLMTMAPLSIVPREIVEREGESFGLKPKGTGPYVLKSWVQNSSLVFHRHDTYRRRQDAAGEVLPLSETLHVSQIAEEATQILMFLDKKLDVLSLTPSQTQQLLIDGKKMKPEYAQRGIRVEFFTNTDLTYTGFNLRDPVLKNKKLREAMAAAYDVRELIRKFYDGLGVPASGPIPPTLAGFEKELAPRVFDVEAARKLLSEAGYPQGKGLRELNYELSSTSTTARLMAEFFKAQMEKIGIRVKIVQNSWTLFSEKVAQGKADIFEMAWNADYPDAENFLQLFYGKNRAPGPNSTGYDDPEYNRLFEEAAKTLDESKRIQLYAQMARRVAGDVPCLFNVHRVKAVALHSWVKNYHYASPIADGVQYYDVRQNGTD